MIDVAGHGDRCGAGAVVLAEEVPDVGGPDRADGRPSAGGVAAEPVVAEHLTSQRAQRHVVGRAVVHGQLLEDHLAFTLDVLIVEQRMRQHIAEQFDTRRTVARHPAAGRVPST